MPKINESSKRIVTYQEDGQTVADIGGGKIIFHSDRPTLTNRGPAGLLEKAPQELIDKFHEENDKIEIPVVVDKVAKEIEHLCIPIGSIVLDPMNARLHPERNIEAIKHSLCMYGQVKPIVVRKDKMTVVAGNGTVETARLLGWTKIAAVVMEMDDITAAGYGLADNRTAELARWDFEVLASIDTLLKEAGHPSIGWSDEELAVMRAADWTPPEVSDTPMNPKSDTKLSFTPNQLDVINHAIKRFKSITPGNDNIDDAQCIANIVNLWVEAVEEGRI